MVLKVVSLYGFYFKEKSVSRRTVLRPPLFSDTRPLGFFDGSSEEDGSKCGVGVVLKCDEIRLYKISIDCGRGTNTRGELLSLWLFFARFKMFSQF